MKNIEFTGDIQFGEQKIDRIAVAPLLFVAFAKLWEDVSADTASRKGKALALMQRKRIVHQTHFMSGDKRVLPDDAQIAQLPIPVARSIIAHLDDDQGTVGKLLNDGDGVATPVHYQLGTPIQLAAKGDGKPQQISELEFKASTFGELEDVLATSGEVPQTAHLLRTIAKPVEIATLTSLPSWAVDRITVADGVTISNLVLPRFLG
ncbi:hypothetical protein [Synechococcus phage Ssp-JY38]|nr:hypothetical protein [Synechococcus phage Yong-L2-223]